MKYPPTIDVKSSGRLVLLCADFLVVLEREPVGWLPQISLKKITDSYSPCTSQTS